MDAIGHKFERGRMQKMSTYMQWMVKSCYYVYTWYVVILKQTDYFGYKWRQKKANVPPKKHKTIIMNSQACALIRG